MKNKSTVFWSSLLTFVMVFLFCTQPLTSKAAEDAGREDLPTLIETAPEAMVEPDVLPLIAPIAASAFSSTVVNSIFAVALGWYVGYETQSLFQTTVNDKKYSSTAQYTVTTTPAYYDSYPEYIESTRMADSAGKHMPTATVLEIHNRIKNWSNDDNFRSYNSTENPSDMLYVIDINSQLGPVTVNRHLGNYISGFTGYATEDLNFKNEQLDLKDYSIFIITKKSNKLIIHAHFMPQWLRDREIEYMRYRGQFNVQIHPTQIRDDKYLMKTSGYTTNRDAAMRNRGLLRDSYNRPSVVPYK